MGTGFLAKEGTKERKRQKEMGIGEGGRKKGREKGEKEEKEGKGGTEDRRMGGR